LWIGLERAWWIADIWRGWRDLGDLLSNFNLDMTLGARGKFGLCPILAPAHSEVEYRKIDGLNRFEFLPSADVED
jgi:hypothetical protein